MKPSSQSGFLSHHPEPPKPNINSSRDFRVPRSPGPWGWIELHALSAADFQFQSGCEKILVWFCTVTYLGLSQLGSLVLVHDVA
jgi:hypothetical protein